jgi:hypothetical protein
MFGAARNHHQQVAARAEYSADRQSGKDLDQSGTGKARQFRALHRRPTRRWSKRDDILLTIYLNPSFAKPI